MDVGQMVVGFVKKRSGLRESGLREKNSKQAACNRMK